MPLQRFPIGDFRGGLVTTIEPSDLANNEAQDLLNVDITDRGALKSRGGSIQFDAGGFPAGAGVGVMHDWEAKDLLICSNRANSDSGNIFSVTTAGVATRRYNYGGGGFDTLNWDFETAVNSSGVAYLWAMPGSFIPGSPAPQKWDGATASTVAWAGSPPAGSMCKVWKNRMIVSGVAANPQRLYFSDIGNPESWPANNFVDIKGTEDDGDPIMWIDVLKDYLIVFKKNSIWRVYDGTTFANVRVGAPGIESRFQSAVIGERIYWFHRSGIWSSTGVGAPRYESEAVENLIRDRVPANAQNLRQVRVYAAPGERLLVSYPSSGSNINNITLECLVGLEREIEGATDLTRAPWLKHDIPLLSMCTFRKSDGKQVLLGSFLPSSYSTLMRIFEPTAFNDIALAINSYWFTGWKSLIADEPIERLRRVNFSSRGRVKVDVYRDFDFSTVFHTATVDSPYTPQPTWLGGNTPWQPGEPAIFQYTRPESRARYHALKFGNNVVSKGFYIASAELVLRGGKEHR